MQRELEHLSNMPSILQRADYEDCLIAFYFGRGKDKLALCRRRAYGDFKRTLHGIGTDVYPRAEKVLGQRLASIKNMEAPSQDQFDAWHRDTCVALAQCGYPFSVGQAQKWKTLTASVHLLSPRWAARGPQSSEATVPPSTF